jgi:hypothetical protein
MLKLMLIAAALPLVPLALAHAPSPSETGVGEPTDPVHCEIRATPMPGGVQLEATVLSKHRLAGDYRLQVDKRGAGGTSSSTQSGDFQIAAGAEEVVGEVGLGLESGASYRAELTIRWPGGETACVRSHPDRI